MTPPPKNVMFYGPRIACIICKDMTKPVQYWACWAKGYIAQRIMDYKRSMNVLRPHKLDSQFIVTTFHFFDEGGRSIFNIQYQYLDRGGRGLVFCSRFSAGRLLQKGHLFASGDAKSSNTGISYQYLPSGKKHLARSKHLHLARNI